jgi:cell division protein FtsW (lipid II flippase)
MSRESLFPFLPAALAAVTDVLTAGIVVAHQPDYPAEVAVYQVLMLGAALLAAVPTKWAWFAAFGILMAGVAISALSVGCSIFHRSLRLCG